MVNKVRLILWWLAFCMLSAVASAQPVEQQGDVPQTYTRSTPLPDSLGLQAMTPEEVKKVASSFPCGGWVYLPKVPGSNEPGAPVMSLVGTRGIASGAPSGVAKIRGNLYPVRSRPLSVDMSNKPPLQTGFFVGPFVSVKAQDDAVAVQKNPDRYPDGVLFTMHAIGGGVAKTRTFCTLGSGLCRRYHARYESQWWAHTEYSWQRPARVETAELIIEDRCPYTRAGMIESYASRLGILEDFHRLFNP